MMAANSFRLILALSFVLSGKVTFAGVDLENGQQEPGWAEDTGSRGAEDEETPRDRQYRWLYELLFPETLRRDKPDETWKSFRVHLKDSDQQFPDPALIRRENLRVITQISGTMTYVGFVSKKYVYDILRSPSGELIFNVRVHLKNASESDIADFSFKMQQASAIWNLSAVNYGFAYSFWFEIVRDPLQAHFSVNMKDDTRGPYDTNWSRKWTSVAVAHELGHMLGLGDEYQTLSGQSDCYESSLMCDSWTGSPMPHHYYFILRRLLKQSLRPN